MVSTVPDILAKIVAQTRTTLPALARQGQFLEAQAAARRAERRDFRAALTANPPAIIAEIKKASPSKGLLAADFQPALLARQYTAGGAAALSVLTDAPFFQGSLNDLAAARAATSVPVLRKDFTLDELHILEAAAHGADAILIIAALFRSAEIHHLLSVAQQYGLAALVEVHDEEELDCALAADASIIGVNNRDLRSFHVNVDVSRRLAARIPDPLIRVSESGLAHPDHLRELQAVGYHGFLIGESLVRSADPAAALRELRGC